MHLITITTGVPKAPFLYPSFLDLRYCSRLLPNGIVARPGNTTGVLKLEFQVR